MTEYRSNGVRTAGVSLVVHFTENVGTTVRHSTVSVPFRDLVNSAAVAAGLERAARRLLLEHWSGQELPEEPLF